MAHIMQILEETGAFGVLGPVNAQHKLTVQWPNSPPFEPGQSVPGHLLNSARSQPKVFTDFQVSERVSDYHEASRLRRC